MTKLQGAEYLDYWDERMRQGPLEAGHHMMDEEDVRKQGERFFQEIWALREAHLGPLKRIAELGCGYGRILRQFGEKEPAETEFHGVDLSTDAIMACETGDFDPMRFFFRQGTQLCLKGAADLVYTCTCLQHITCPEYFEMAVRSIVDALAADGHVIILENGVRAPGSRHVRGLGFEDYLGAFDQHGLATLASQPPVDIRGEPHRAFLLGR
jgi:SAM-dependent methyltransferase